MAEKNTLSILESIKQKMAKFDEKGQKSITAFDNDFDYPASNADEMKQAATSEVNIENKTNMNLIHDEKEENDAVNNDDFLFDHEQEEEEKKKDFLHEDLDLEDDFEEDFEEENDEKDEEESKEESSEIEDIDDEDFLLSKEENITKKPEVKEEEDHGLDLDLDDDNFDIEEDDQVSHEVKPAEVKQEIKSVVVENKKEEEDIDDLDVDFDEFEEDGKKPEITQNPLLEELDEEEENVEDEEFEFEEERKLKQLETPQAKVEDKDKMASQVEEEGSIGIDLDVENSSESSDQNVQQRSIGYNQSVNIPIRNLPLETNSSISAIPSRKASTSSRSLLHEETLQQATSSIKKLMEANNVVQGIKAFTDKNDAALNEIAVQLMESRLERWLNDHLPDLVEKIVREEIKKIMPKE